MIINYINNRFLEDSAYSEIQNQSLEDLLEGKYTRTQKKRFNSLVKTLVSIAKDRVNYEGHPEAKPEDDFVNALRAALGISKYAKPKIESIKRTPDFSFSRLNNKDYMNFYTRSKTEFWKATDFLLEVKPIDFMLEGYDPDTKMLWVDKCAWFTKTAGVKIGVLTNFSTWYFVRSSDEDEAKYLALFLEGSQNSSNGELVEYSEDVLERNAVAIAKMLFLITNESIRERLSADFESVDNEELNIADSLLPRFIDSISLIASDLEGTDDRMIVREAMTSVFCAWSVLSRSEILGLDVQKNLSIGEDYLGNLKKYLENPTSNNRKNLNDLGASVCRSISSIQDYIISTLPDSTKKEFRKSRKVLNFDTLHKVAFLLFVETEKNKISIRGTHRIGASSISTIFEGTLSFNVEKLSKVVDNTKAYWDNSLGSAPDVARILIKKVILVEPPQTNDKLRKKLGAYFTPTPICDFLIGKLDFHLVKGKNPIAIDPTCGTGQFLLAYLRRLASLEEVEPSSLHKRIIGNDIEPIALFVSAYRLNSYLSRVIGKMNKSSLNLFCLDFTSPQKFEELKKQIPIVSHVIGNPPFGAEGNGNKNYSNTWQSCLYHVTRLAKPVSVGMVVPASFANTSEVTVKDLRNLILKGSVRFHAVAFDTRPKPIFPDNDQRPMFLSFDFGFDSKKKEILSGGFRRHSASKSIGQSLQEIKWQELEFEQTFDLFPLPSNKNEAKLIRFAFDQVKKNQNVTGHPSGERTRFPISVLAYGRYNLNAIIGLPPRRGGNKWKTYYFSSEEASARMVVGLNSNLGWALFRSLTNGLDFNKRLVTIIGSLPTGAGKKASCIKIAGIFSTIMRKAYEKYGEFKLAGRFDEFSSLNKAAESAFGLKKHGFSVKNCSDIERIRVLKKAA